MGIFTYHPIENFVKAMYYETLIIICAFKI